MMNLSIISCGYDSLRSFAVSAKQSMSILLAVGVLAAGPGAMELTRISAQQSQTLDASTMKAHQGGVGILELGKRNVRAFAALGTTVVGIASGIGAAMLIYSSDNVASGYTAIFRGGVGLGLGALAVGLGAFSIWLLVRNHRHNRQFLDDHTEPFNDHNHEGDHSHSDS
ncbi:hypothetical protein JYT83_00940 [bacterium AH-315-F18]|nr:hypothetical protein [bacterium AH-315-F18]